MLLRFLRVLELAGFITSSLGIYYLKRRSQNEQLIPRNICCCCLCCCDCPFLPWSLIVASGLDILGILLWLAFRDEGADVADFIFVVLAFIACVIDGTFGGYWLKLVNNQDKSLCCGSNAPPPVQAQPVQGNAVVTVVGQPIGLEVTPEGEKPVQGAPVEQKA
eukprot:gnl/MRDRNA2_/MRDRNA2_76453_c0_seq1.p1 gnl/MRDRNA2_/MRDRNA2_76453_c0~~gnl/MRDRNA2_/MRDRNA2_76453_c0_seq1.p1  ORF type:complete len:163 (+),score=16.52 gnl/MRDRNA2_/MRDRNA2_76453_c0_seq1:2-490(+)